MTVNTFIIGNREFTATKMNAFDAGKHLLKLKDIIAPALIEFSSAEATKNINVFELLSALDPQVHEDVVFPILTAAQTYSVTDKRKISTPMDMNFCFTVDTLIDFYLLVWEVLKLNFAPFIERATSLFGNLNLSTSNQEAER